MVTFGSYAIPSILFQEEYTTGFALPRLSRLIPAKGLDGVQFAACIAGSKGRTQTDEVEQHADEIVVLDGHGNLHHPGDQPARPMRGCPTTPMPVSPKASVQLHIRPWRRWPFQALPPSAPYGHQQMFITPMPPKQGDCWQPDSCNIGEGHTLQRWAVPAYLAAVIEFLAGGSAPWSAAQASDHRASHRVLHLMAHSEAVKLIGRGPQHIRQIHRTAEVSEYSSIPSGRKWWGKLLDRATTPTTVNTSP